MADVLTELITSTMGQPLLLLLLANVLLLLFAPWIVDLIEGSEPDPKARLFRINLMRGLNLLVIIILSIALVTGHTQIVNNVIVKLLLAVVVVYVAVIATQLFSRLIRIRYGKRIESAGAERIADTYASRALTISAGVFISIVALISVVRLFGYENLLQASGVIGFVGVFLALTQGAWAPDIISGLVILNTRILAERDVVKLKDGEEEIIARVYRTRAFHTELLNLVDNHRILIRNSRIRDFMVHNLSRFATARGLRESLHFKIGYNVSAKRTREMFERVYEIACQRSDLEFEKQHPCEVRLQDTGDHAIAWSFHYYTKDAQSIVGLRQAFRELVLDVCTEMDIDLSTPISISGSSDALSV